MAKKKTIGKCALCKTENIELMESHIIPNAIYRRTKTFEISRFRNYYDLKELYQDGEKKPMLCHECEEFFSWYETKFCNMYLDKYLKSSSNKLPEKTDIVDFYILTVAWRILYDDLYIYNSFSDDSEKSIMVEFEMKLSRFLYQKYISEHPEKTSNEPVPEIPDLEGKCYGEIIAEIEKYQRMNEPEDISEIDNYVYTLNELSFNSKVVELFDSLIFGYSYYIGDRSKYIIISGYKGLIIATVYCRKRNIFITDDWKAFLKSRNTERNIKNELIYEVNQIICEMRKKYPENQKTLDTGNMRNNISKRYENQKRLR